MWIGTLPSFRPPNELSVAITLTLERDEITQNRGFPTRAEI
jgi:hypothetical protein